MNIQHPSSMAYLWQRLLMGILALFTFLPIFNSAHAQDSICAEVKIVIEQKLSFERQAFDAKMILRNGLETCAIQNVGIELLFADNQNNPVVATQDPNALGAKFFYRTESLKGIDVIDGAGIVAPQSSAEIHWMIIPSAGAAQTSGTLYYVGAKVTYTLNDVTTTVEVTPDYIIVKPQPMLTLDYFLPTDVYADDPFTEEVEPQVPFTLGVRIKNSGGGDAIGTQIESAQPKIVENKQNLLIGFEILGGYVLDQLAGKSLLLDFGDVQAGTSKVGRWNMVTTLSGKFVEFDASFTHADNLGGAVTSLIQGVNTHTLVHDVKVDLPGRDNVRDFLANDNNVMRVYESEGIDTVVINQSAHANLSTASGQAQLTFPATPGFVYAQVSDPARGNNQPVDVQRSDGKTLPEENVWLSKVFNQNTTWSYFINVFDVDSTGSYTFAFVQEDKSSLSGIVYVDVNKNGVQDNNETGIANVAVTLARKDASGEDFQAQAYTDAQGQFTFTGLDAGRYAVSIAPVSGMRNGAVSTGTASGLVAEGAVNAIILAGAQNAQGYTFGKQTIETSSIAGRAIYTTLTNIQSALVGANIYLIGEADGQSVQATATTDTNGNFIFEGLAPGLYQLSIQNIPGTRNSRMNPGSSGGNPDPYLTFISNISLKEGVNAKNYSFTKNQIPVGTSSLSGYVYHDANGNGVFDNDEQGVAGSKVSLLGGQVSTVIYTDETGQFEFRELPNMPTTYILSSDYNNRPFEGTLTAGSAGGITKNSSSGINAPFINQIRLGNGVQATGYYFGRSTPLESASLSGTVFDDLNGNGQQDANEPGIGGVAIRVNGTDNTRLINVDRTIYTQANGKFEFDHLNDGSYHLTVGALNGMTDGTATAGSSAGTSSEGKITGINLKAGVSAQGYLFAKRAN